MWGIVREMLSNAGTIARCGKGGDQKGKGRLTRANRPFSSEPDVRSGSSADIRAWRFFEWTTTAPMLVCG
jgi:hypothetical protein